MDSNKSDTQSKSSDTNDIHITETYLRSINQFAISLIQFTKVDDLVWHVAVEVVGKLDFVDCVIYLYDKTSDRLIQSAAIGEKSPEKHVIINQLKIPLGSGITGTVALTRQAVIVNDTLQDNRYLEDLSEFRSEICVPMIYEDELIGVIDSEHPEANYFTDLHLEILTTIAAMTAGKISQCRNQRRMRTQAGVIGQVSEAVLLVKKDGTIIDNNSAAERMCQRSREQLIGTNAFTMVAHPTELETIEPILRQELRDHDLWTGRVEMLKGTEKQFMAEVHITHLDQTEQEEDIYIVVARDITEQVKKERLERELQQAQKMESLGHLTGGIAHDFNNLLGIITGYSDLAMHQAVKTEDTKLQKYLNQIQDAARRATNLVTQMLAFSRSAPVEEKPIHLEDILRGDANMLRATLPSTIEIDIDIEGNLPPVLIDSTRVHQLLMNLCVNARDAMDSRGAIRIKLMLSKDLDTESPISHRPVRGNWVELSVSDTGTGIDIDNMKKIFNPFFTTKRVGEGTGMGLSVVYKIMDEHDGHILIDSVVGEGTTFRLLFHPAESANSDNSDEVGVDTKSDMQGDGSHIMIVDDEDSLAVLIGRVVEERGFHATAMSDSTAALEELRANANQYSLLITDQTMPKMTGIELISEVRKFAPELPVILCTGYSDKIDANLARELNIPFFDKPINMEKLMATISMSLQSDKQ